MRGGAEGSGTKSKRLRTVSSRGLAGEAAQRDPLVNTSQQIAQHLDFVASPRYAVEAEFPRTAKLAGLQQRQ